MPLDGLFDCRLTFDIRCVAAGVRKREVLDFEKGVSEKGLEHEGTREVRGERNTIDQRRQQRHAAAAGGADPDAGGLDGRVPDYTPSREGSGLEPAIDYRGLYRQRHGEHKNQSHKGRVKKGCVHTDLPSEELPKKSVMEA